jgi:hypothetical protein
MNTALNLSSIVYPDCDGQPMTESDATRDYLIYDGVPYLVSQTLGLELHLKDSSQVMGVAPLPKALRFYDPQTDITLPSRKEVEAQLSQVQQERDAAQQERDAAQQERDLAHQRSQQLAAQLRALGVEPGQLE